MKNPQIDTYIAKAPNFARPILEKLRRLFHQACPDIEEKVKWRCPSFEYKGMVGGFAAFQNHATFGFWRQDVLPDPLGLFKSRGPMGVKLTDISELPADDVVLRYMREAVKLNESGARPPRATKKKPPLKAPAYFMAALRRNRKALATFEAFPPSHKREYVEWVVEAKQDATRGRRLATAIELMAQGKPQNWKYMK